MLDETLFLPRFRNNANCFKGSNRVNVARGGRSRGGGGGGLAQAVQMGIPERSDAILELNYWIKVG